MTKIVEIGKLLGVPLKVGVRTNKRSVEFYPILEDCNSYGGDPSKLPSRSFFSPPTQPTKIGKTKSAPKPFR